MRQRPARCLLPLAIVLVSSTTPLRADPVDAGATVAAHNEWRERDGVGPIQWSSELQSEAERWALSLKENDQCGARHSGGDSGENLYWASPRQTASRRDEDGNWIWENSLQDVTPKDVVDSWGNEKQWYDYDSNACNAPAGESCGHYTQVVWRDTTEVGCAKAVCDDFSQVWVCNYAPAGNVSGQRPF